MFGFFYVKGCGLIVFDWAGLSVRRVPQLVFSAYMRKILNERLHYRSFSYLQV